MLKAGHNTKAEEIHSTKCLKMSDSSWIKKQKNKISLLMDLWCQILKYVCIFAHSCPCRRTLRCRILFIFDNSY